MLVSAIVGHLAVDTTTSVVQLGLVRRHLEHLVAEVAEASVIAVATGVVGARGVLVVRGHVDLLGLTGEAEATRDEDLAVCGEVVGIHFTLIAVGVRRDYLTLLRINSFFFILL